MKTAILTVAKKAATKEVQTTALTGLEETESQKYALIPDTVGFVYHNSFSSPSTEDKLFGENANQVEVPAWTHFPEVPEDIPTVHAKRMTLSGADEIKLFLSYNYARYRLAKLIKAQQRRKALARARQMIMWHDRVLAARGAIARANMALVLAMAKRTRIPNVEFTELISEGNMALLRSVEKFDVARGFKFSTYACRAILKSFNRLATKTGRYRQHFPTEFDPELEQSDHDVRQHEIQREDSIEALREILTHNRAHLTDVEKTIVLERFSLATGGKGRTLAEVGKIVGLTNERVRQIQNGALTKIRIALDDGYLVA
ncbi:MAG: sigma-70 family RNA polymerase sigma factor [Planctomycetaceae bacterium]|nr:MAG: sigma-70 family RNA polymerase sigma factor [Planctomycetaceae bacterium]